MGKVRTQPLELRRSGVGSPLHHFQSVCPWASDFTSLGFSTCIKWGSSSSLPHGIIVKVKWAGVGEVSL